MSFADKYRREISVAVAYALLLLALAIFRPDFYSHGQFTQTWIMAAPIIVAAIGMTLVIVAREIDISVGSMFSICAIVGGLAARGGWPVPAAAVAAVLAGVVMGALNGVLIAFAGLPSIVVTLGTMVIFRYALMYLTQGALLNGLPANFQWLGFSQNAGEWILIAVGLVLLILFAWSARHVAAGRAIYAVGSDREAARLAGIRPRLVIFSVFLLMGGLIGLASMLDAIRFPNVDPKAGTGSELQIIAAVVVGGTAISGGRGTLIGTLIGVILLITVTPALTFFHIPSQWEKAVQGAIILAAVTYDGILRRET